MTSAATNGIELRGIEKTYRAAHGSVRAVRGIDVTVAPGETVALLGPNGAGKSTTIDMLLGLQQPDAGDIALFGETPQNAVKAGRVGAMLHTGGLLRDLTVRELVTMMASLYPNALSVDDALGHARVTELAHRRTEKLSGGETQRVRFAIGLVSNPDLLVLDEPTVGMDVEARHSFWTTVRDFASRGKTVLFATHYLDEADAYADRIVLVRSGRIVADGTTAEIKAMASGRSVRATLPDAEEATIAALPGVDNVEIRGDRVIVQAKDSDLVARYLLTTTDARDLEISAHNLEDAFLALTADDNGVPAQLTGSAR